jgi:hypothetical protein
MNKSIGLLVILLLSSIPAYAETDPNVWNGFRDLKWGTNIKDANDPNMVLISDSSGNDEIQVYRRSNDKLSFGDAKLTSISYSFYKDRLCLVMIKAKEDENYTALKAALFAYYGKGNKQENNSINIKKWEWASDFANCPEDVRMTLKYDLFNGETELLMFYKPIYNEIVADKAKKGRSMQKISITQTHSSVSH